jgi:subtilase family serine protease
MARLKRSPRTAGMRTRKTRMVLEQLESRNLLAYSPAQIAHAYGFDLVKPSDGTLRGTGQTIAIVDAYDNPNILADLQRFDATFGLPDPPSFQKLTPQGKPATDTGWALEIALDVEWAHAIAPGASIDLVESADSSGTNLYAADMFAGNQTGVSAVSNSWGGGEYFSETADDKNFTHTGVTYIFSSGDSGAPPEYPSASPNVLAVGGTTLSIDSAGNYISERGWGHGFWSFYFGGSGGGISQVEPKPAFQSSVTQSSTKRTTPDVAFDADPNTGVYVYDATNGGWFQVGGTSLGAPAWAGLMTIVNQGRAINGASSLSGSDTLSQIYKVSANDFHDQTSGNNGYSAGPGYDLVTGRGSPKANLLIPDLVATVVSSGSTSSTTPTMPPFSSARSGLSRMTAHLVVSTQDNNAALANAALFNRTTVLQSPIPPAPPAVLGATPIAISSQTPAATRISSIALSGSSDELTDDQGAAETLSVMPASYQEETQRPAGPAAPASDDSSVVPMSHKAIDGVFLAPFPATDVTEGAVAAPLPSESVALPAADLSASELGFLALVGGLWTVRVAGEEEKRPAMRR